jgi:hypothetical protein
MPAVSARFLGPLTANNFWHPDDILPAAIDNPYVGDSHSIEEGTGKIRRIGGA